VGLRKKRGGDGGGPVQAAPRRGWRRGGPGSVAPRGGGLCGGGLAPVGARGRRGQAAVVQRARGRG
jgi:hypothetical protein